MSKIHLLTENVCNKIAAGEVIERPASVVKELVENSLDAGALAVSVSIEKAGQKLISVRDDGEGMDGDDAVMCLESHATSKIRNEEDILEIHSFGFRGEAVPSMASVSRFTIRTRRRENQEGVEIVVNGGKFVSSTPAGCAPGTEIDVRDLFYNVPARKKFVKSAATEEHHIVETVTAVALAHPEAAFELKMDGRSVITSPAAQDLTPRIRELFGKEYADNLLPVSKTENGITVTGFVSKRTYTRAGRSEQRIYVNGRCVESPAVYKGIREGSGPMLERGRALCAILFITLDTELVDINVHPAKREVRFRDDFQVTAAVRSAVTTALRAGDTVIPFEQNLPDNGLPVAAGKLYNDFTVAENMPDMDTVGRILRSALIDYHVTGTQIQTGVYSSARETQAIPVNEPLRNTEDSMIAPELIATTQEPTDEKDMPAPDAFRLVPEEAVDSSELGGHDLRIIGVLENSYIIGAIPGGLVLIDQHAAHERVLFEKLMKGTDGSLAQKLLIPIPLELSRADMRLVTQSASEFARIGYEIDVFGENTVKLNAIPYALNQNNAGGVFQDILARLSESGSSRGAEYSTIARAACKAAVKSHDKLSMQECEALVKEMAKCELPFSCPHGRPTVINISIAEIERRFGRK